MSTRDRIRQIVERWFLIEPLLFSVWTTHDLVVEPRIRTVRVRQGRIEYNPRFIEGLDRRQLEAVLRCEAVRILLKHPYQRRKENPPLAYLASNVTLQEYMQTELPLPRARDLFGTDEFDRQYFEFYYYKLQDLAGQAALAALSGLGTDDTPAAGTAERATQETETQAGGGEGSPIETYAAAEMVGRENAEGWDADDFLTDRIDGQIRAAQESNRWGTIAGRLREQVLATLRPALDYRAVLRQFRASILSTQRVLTRMKPSRRYGFLYMGSRYDLTTHLLVAVDVSGSMGSEDLARGFSTINQFFRYGVRQVDVIQFDTEIRGEPLSLKRARRTVVVVGRGGTSFAPVMAYIDEHRAYDGLIVFTDGYAPVPPRPHNRRTRVLWLFNSQSTYQRMHEGLRHIGPAVYLRETGMGVAGGKRLR